MAFENLSERLQNAIKMFRGSGKITEDDLKAPLREVRMALLEADVNFKVVKDFVANIKERAGKLGSLLRKKGKKPLLVAGDVYRPAAIKQLEVLG